MKKNIVLLLVLALLLSGCVKEPAATEAPSDTTPTVTDPPIPDSPYPMFPNYDYENPVEAQTGAVGVYPLEGEGYYAVQIMGDGVLLFSGEDQTTLTALSEQGMYTMELADLITPEQCSVQVGDQGVGYYDVEDHSVVFLDTKLQETTRISMPEDLTGELALSADWESVYYFNATELRCLELSSGISRLLKECSFAQQDVIALHFDGAVLECCINDGEVDQTLFVDTATGNMLFMGEEFPMLYTAGDYYFAQWFDGIETLNIFGVRGGVAKCFVPGDESFGLYGMPVAQGAALTSGDAEGSVVDYYDLVTGKRTASLEMKGVYLPFSLVEDGKRGLIWFLGGSEESKTDTLYCWDPGKSPVEDEQIYTQTFHTDDDPDTEGLENCAKLAQELASKYRIRIRVWTGALKTEPSDYTFTPESRVSVYETYLTILERALAVYPEDIFKKLGNASENDYLTISLVREITGSSELGSLEQADGVHYWNDGSGYIALAMNDVFEETFHHELFHGMDSYILTETLAYDFWNEMNPKGFQYDLSYIANQGREDWQYLEDETRSFIDMYSMSFPKEDRARIMQYAVMPGNESYFQSDTMQNKLKTLCSGIREAFKLKGDAYLWEQYLN